MEPPPEPEAIELPLNLDALRELLRAHGAVFALLFGSHADGTAREDSDVDIAGWFAGAVDRWALWGQLPPAVDLVDLARAPCGLAGRIALTGVVVLDDDPVRRIRWQAETRKRHLDEAWRREQFRRDFARAHG